MTLQTHAAPLELVTPALSELAQLDQWVISKLVEGRDKNGNITYDKPPFSPHTRGKCSHSNPEHWSSYQTARSALRGFSWLGFVFSEYDPYSGIDLDGCRDKDTGAIEPWAQRIIDLCSSYTEISPSGTGVKIWVRGTLPEQLVHSMGAHKGIEVYSSRRYFTFTGQHLDGTPVEIHDAQTVLDLLWTEYHKEPEPAAPRAPRQSPGERAVTTSSPSIPDVLTILLDDGAIQTSTKDLTCPYCNHTHKNTLFIFKGRVYSRSPGCIIPQKGGLDTVGLHAVRDYGSNTDANRIAVLKARYPIQPRQTRQAAPEGATEYVLPPEIVEARRKDAQRKREQLKQHAAEVLADVRARAAQDTTLTECDRAVLDTLLKIAGDRDWCRPSKERIVEISGYSLGAVKRALASPEAKQPGRLEGRYFTSEGDGGSSNQTAIRTFLRGSSTSVPAAEMIPESCIACDLNTESEVAREGGPSSPAVEPVDPELLIYVHALACDIGQPCDLASHTTPQLLDLADRLAALLDQHTVPAAVEHAGAILTGPAGAVAIVGGAAYVPAGAEAWYQALQQAEISTPRQVELDAPAELLDRAPDPEPLILSPPADTARRNRYYALRGKAKKTTSEKQRYALNRQADALCEWLPLSEAEQIRRERDIPGSSTRPNAHPSYAPRPQARSPSVVMQGALL